MAFKIFVNLPVKDLNRSIEFLSKLGFAFNKEFTDDKAACMSIGDHIYSMLLVEDRFRGFTKKVICNAHTSTQVLVAIDAESRGQVDESAISN